MFAKTLACLGATTVVLASCNTPAPRASVPTIQGQSMARMLATVKELRAFAQSGTDRPHAEQAAAELVAWSGRMGELFPPGVNYVELTPEMTRAAARAMLATSQDLLGTVRSGSRQVVGGQLARTEQEGCGGCHREQNWYLLSGVSQTRLEN